MKFLHQATIDVDAAAIDLPDWLFSLSEADYAACASGHRGIGVNGGGARTGMINVESIGGSLLIQHYATRCAERDHVTMVSDASRAYVMHLVPVTCGVVWDMSVRADGPRKSLFECKVDIDLPRLVRLLGYTNGAPIFIRRHVVEETHGFARSIARRFG